MNILKRRAAIFVLGVILCVAAAVCLARYDAGTKRREPARLVYTAQGYGGFVAPAMRPRQASAPMSRGPGRGADAIDAIRQSYRDGRYAEAEAAAQRFIDSAAAGRSVAVREQAAGARQVLAYSLARRHDLVQARAQFAALHAEADRLPGGGMQAGQPGEAAPSLAAEAAFQHAVCTGALGDKPAAEGEYRAFIASYPDSPLIWAATRRIAAMHGGNVPSADAAVWRRAESVARRDAGASERAQALCAPECLAELLRRQGGNGAATNVEALADQMHTGAMGTNLADLQAAARQHGWAGAQGMVLTPKGLGEQTLPVIAYVLPGHYVLVDAIAAEGVRIWDPDADGLGKGAPRLVDWATWARYWRGVALALEPSRADAERAAAERS